MTIAAAMLPLLVTIHKHRKLFRHRLPDLVSAAQGGQLLGSKAPLKTRNSYRRVSISPQAIEVLKQQKAKTNSDYVFPSPTGSPISPDSVNNMLKRVLTRAGIPKVRLHDLRHTFATIALQNGVDIKTASSILGHFSAGFTANIYAHVIEEADQQNADILASVFLKKA